MTQEEYKEEIKKLQKEIEYLHSEVIEKRDTVLSDIRDRAL